MSTAILIVVLYVGSAVQPLIHMTQETDMNTCHDSRVAKVQQIETYNRTHAEESLHHWVVVCVDLSDMVRPRWAA